MAKNINAIVACVAVSLLISGCSSAGSVIDGTAAQICQTWRPVFTSKDDRFTADTAKMIAGNNEANRRWCGTSPPPRPATKTS